MIAFKGRKPKMKMSVHALAMETYLPALRTLSELLDKGIEHSKAKGIDVAALLKERLAPDMFPPMSRNSRIFRHCEIAHNLRQY
jgi:hypothetical protein